MLVSDMRLMSMPIFTILQIGQAIIELAEIRHPYDQLNAIHPFLMGIVMPDKVDSSTHNIGTLGIIVQGGMLQLEIKFLLLIDQCEMMRNSTNFANIT